jgi:hypothetical protein
MPAIISIDDNNNCRLIIENCAPYDDTIDPSDVIGLMDIKTDLLSSHKKRHTRQCHLQVHPQKKAWAVSTYFFTFFFLQISIYQNVWTKSHRLNCFSSQPIKMGQTREA